MKRTEIKEALSGTVHYVIATAPKKEATREEPEAPAVEDEDA